MRDVIRKITLACPRNYVIMQQHIYITAPLDVHFHTKGYIKIPRCVLRRFFCELSLHRNLRKIIEGIYIRAERGLFQRVYTYIPYTQLLVRHERQSVMSISIQLSSDAHSSYSRARLHAGFASIASNNSYGFIHFHGITRSEQIECARGNYECIMQYKY